MPLAADELAAVVVHDLRLARAEGLPYDMGALVREAAALLGGRGGGRPAEAQGGGPEVGKLEEALILAHRRLPL